MDNHWQTYAQEDHILFERILWRVNYFWCGHSSDCYYNTHFIGTMEAIGKYCNPIGTNSKYHNGVAYIAKQSGVTKTQVKAMRKRLKSHNGYEFKTSYSIARIMTEIIKALKENSDKEEVKNLMKGNSFYRDMIAYEQYTAIRNAAKDSADERLRKITASLNMMQDTYP